MKTFYDDFFGKPLSGSDPKTLGEHARKAFEILNSDYKELCTQTEHYPFYEMLTIIESDLGAVTGKSYDYYLTELTGHAKALLEAKDQILDPVKHFMEGSHRGIYDEAATFYRAYRSHFDNDDPDLASLSRALEDPQIFKSTKGLKTALDRLQNRLASQREETLKCAVSQFEILRQQIQAMPNYEGADPAVTSNIMAAFDHAIADTKTAQSIPGISVSPRWFKDTTYPGLLALRAARDRRTGCP